MDRIRVLGRTGSGVGGPWNGGRVRRDGTAPVEVAGAGEAGVTNSLRSRGLSSAAMEEQKQAALAATGAYPVGT